MDEKQLEETVRRAATNLFEHQPNMFDFTSETNQTEWNLAHHLAVGIHQFFPDLDCDVDVIKVNLERKRPDSSSIDEAAKTTSWLLKSKETVTTGTRSLPSKDPGILVRWFGERLHYQFGATVNLRENKTFGIEVIRN